MEGSDRIGEREEYNNKDWWQGIWQSWGKGTHIVYMSGTEKRGNIIEFGIGCGSLSGL